MISEQYVWLLWSLVLLVLWGLVFVSFPRDRAKMWRVSLITMPFGLTEPIFVPRYWNPPSLFGLAQKTGFDIESLIFCFAVAGISAVLYDLVTRKGEVTVGTSQRQLPKHRLHTLAITSPVIVFLALAWFPWNPIYPAIIAMFVGSVATMLCRPDLKTRTWAGGALFVLLYAFLLQGLRASSPGYIEHTWNLRALTGLLVLGMPVEELLFAASFGVFWSCVYEHVTWHTEQSATGIRLDENPRSPNFTMLERFRRS